MRKIVFWVLLIPFTLSASTFVGNGGNAGDVELQVTLMQIKKTLNQIKNNQFEKNELCSCSESLEGHQICTNLKILSSEQRLFCEKKLTFESAAMLNLLNSPAGLQIVWTLDTMQVAEKAGLREAEGVAVASEGKIFLNREMFLKLKDYERIYLLTHELGHLVKIENKFLKDDEKIGPFKQNDGGRQFLNSLGSAVTMRSLVNGGVDQFAGSLNRSKTYKDNWFSVSFGSESERKDESSFAIKKYTGYQIQYRYQLIQQVGLSIGHREMKGADTFFEIAKTESEISLWSAKLNYRLSPFSNPLSFWGQSHFLFGLGIEAGTAKMSVNDGYSSENDQTKLSSPLLSAHYFIPANHGIWVQTGLVATQYKYEFNKIGFKSQDNQIFYELGVSYGF
jgi:hypothetical protein